MFQVKQNETTAIRRRIPVLLVDATDGYTPETGITGATITVSKNGTIVSAGVAGRSLTEVGNGIYYYGLGDGNSNTANEIDTLGWVSVNVSATGCRNYNAIVQIMAYDAMDVVRLGLTALPNAAAEIAGGLATLSANQSSGGTIPANMVAISGDVTAADNLETAADGGVYNLGGGGIVASSVTNNVGGNVVGNVNGNVAGSVNSVTTGVTLAASSIGTGTFQEGAINANALATDAAEEIANTVWQADNDTKYGGGQYDADSLGRTILRSSNTQAEVDVNGNNHVSAVVHQMQNNVVTAAALDDSAGQDIADQILGRNIAGGSSAGRLVKDSLRFLRNRFTLVGDVLTVYAEDDTTIAWTAVVSTDEAALPITGSNPAGGAA